MNKVCALILAGGLGTRLRTIVNDRPKPLAPIGSIPFLEHQINFLKANQVREFVLCVGYRYEQIQEYFQDGDRWDVSIKYSIEEQAMGTAGALKLAEGYVHGPFLVLNGDTFFSFDISHLLHFHTESRKADASYVGTLALTEVDDPSSYGSVLLDSSNRITGFREKTATAEPNSWISAGVYVLEPHVLDSIPNAQPTSLERETFPRLLNDGAKLLGYRTEGFFVDIGTPEGYFRFQEYAGGISS